MSEPTIQDVLDRLAQMEPQPSWVEARAGCHPSVVFEELRDIVERDVKAFNELPDELRSRRVAKFWRPEDQDRHVFGVSVQIDQFTARDASFTLPYGTEIKISFKQGRWFRLRAQWDPTKARRVLVAEPEQLQGDDEFEALSFTAVWQVSQWVLGWLGFGP